MPTNYEEDDRGSLEVTRQSLYTPGTHKYEQAPMHSNNNEHIVAHKWEEDEKQKKTSRKGTIHIRIAGIFLGISILFFLGALGTVAYFFYSGSNSISPNKITVSVLGPTTIAGGDTIPLSLTITNRNPTAIKNVVLEIDFPKGTRSGINMLRAYPRYIKNIGQIASGGVVTQSVKAVVFGGAGQTITLPISLSYTTTGSSATFIKKTSYSFSVSSTPLSVSVDTLSEAVSNKPVTFVITVRSNATVPVDNIILKTAFPFGFRETSSSLPLRNSNFFIGTLDPGASKKVTLTGTLAGQDKEQRVFHFTVGTAKSSQDHSLAVTYMTQTATVLITAPFITTKLSLNGDTLSNPVINPGSNQKATLSYTNTLPTTVTNALITVTLSGSAIDYNSVKTKNGFYNSVNHTILFSKDTDSSLESLAPNASGKDTFTFSTLPAGIFAPKVVLAVSVSGIRVGQSNVPENVTSTKVIQAKVSTKVIFIANSAYSSGDGPMPPLVGKTTIYTIVWNVHNLGNAVAGGTVTATLPSYIFYTSNTFGNGNFTYDAVSHTVTWNTGNIIQGANTKGVFQISLTPSISQKGNPITLTGKPTFSGYDRFAGIQISANGSKVTTNIGGTIGATSENGIVQ